MIAAIIPTMNEAETIGPLVQDLSRYCDAVIVADDSEDNTALVASAAGAQIIHASGGLDQAYEYGNDLAPSHWWTVHVDAGGSHQIGDVTDLIDIAALRRHDVTIGSRFFPGAKYLGRPARKRMSRVAATMMNIVTGWDIKDWTSGLRVYSPKARTAIREHTFKSTGHAWQIESLWTAIQAGCMVSEHPITYKAGVSHMNAERAREALRLWAQIAKS